MLVKHQLSRQRKGQDWSICFLSLDICSKHALQPVITCGDLQEINCLSNIFRRSFQHHDVSSICTVLTESRDLRDNILHEDMCLLATAGVLSMSLVTLAEQDSMALTAKTKALPWTISNRGWSEVTP